MESPGSESRQGQEIFPPLPKLQTGSGAHPVSHLMGTDFFFFMAGSKAVRA